MNEELLTELLPIFASGQVSEEEEIDLDGSILKVSINKKENENKVVMVVEYIEDDFKKWVNSLDEDIFIEACEKFEEITGKPLSDDTEESDFRAVVSKVIQDKISNLKKFI